MRGHYHFIIHQENIRVMKKNKQGKKIKKLVNEYNMRSECPMFETNGNCLIIVVINV
jgi:hypothetical protein